MRVPPGTDCWRMTGTNECVNNAPFYFLEVEGDFEVRCKVKANYESPDDQAGVMIREDEENWIKCGIQMVGDIPHMCATVTHDYSDMSLHPLPVSVQVFVILFCVCHHLVYTFYFLKNLDTTDFDAPSALQSSRPINIYIYIYIYRAL